MINPTSKILIALATCLPAYVFSGETVSAGGTWTTSPTYYETLISSSTSQTNKILSIKRMSSGPSKTLINVHVDDTILSAPLHQGSEILVTGKKFKLSQSPSDKFGSNGTWTLIDSPKLDTTTTNWSVSPSSGDSHVVVAALSEPHEFIIEYQKTDCTDGRMMVMVDQSYMEPNPGSNKGIINFLPGSAVIGRGKIIEAFLSGKCAEGQTHIGRFSLLPSTL